MLEAARAARAIARAGQSGAVAVGPEPPPRPLYDSADPVAGHPADAKVALLRRLDAFARSLDPRITQVVINLTGSHSVVLIADHTGRLAADVRPLVRLNVTVVAESQGRRESGTAGGGGRHGYDWLFEQGAAEALVREAVRLALVNLEADPTPAGDQIVVLGPGWPGILLHEAVGHGLEGDFNRKGSSAFAGRLGERVAAPGVTVVDDGTLPGRRGSLNVDDEGTPTGTTVLIEDGILCGYLQDRMNAALMQAAPTGNARRQSWAHRPMPRMTNTYMLAGRHDPGEIIASVDRGIYAVNFGGGQVDITNGKFVFTTSEAYLIENGRVTRPVKGATLIGNGPDVLTRVSMVGNDLALDSGIGTCGKLGQGVPVGVGQPTLRIDRLTVGGTAG
jgi:TldD protein